MIPDKDDPNKSTLKLLAEIDLGGNVPAFAVKAAFKE